MAIVLTHHFTAWNGTVLDLTTPGRGQMWITADGIEGMKAPDTDEFTQALALVDGQRFSGFRVPPRDVFWPLFVDGRDGSIGYLQSQLSAAMKIGRYGVWRVQDDVSGIGRELQCRFVKYQDPAWKQSPYAKGYVTQGVVLIADAEPMWLGDAIEVTIQAAADALPFYATSGAVFNIMPGNTVADVELSNPGDVPAFYTIRIDGPVTGFNLLNVAGTVTVEAGEWLIIDTNPQEQIAKLYHDATNWDDVTADLTGYSPAPVPVGATSYTFTDNVINGTGSATISLRPRYFEAF